MQSISLQILAIKRLISHVTNIIELESLKLYVSSSGCQACNTGVGGVNYPIFLLEDKAINVWYIESPAVTSYTVCRTCFWPTPDIITWFYSAYAK